MREKIFKNSPLFFGIICAVFIGFLEGVGVENVITEQIFKAIRSGDIVGIAGYCLIFFLIWLQVRGLRAALEKLNGTIANSFSRGEARFTEIEHRQHLTEDRLTAIELIVKGIK